MIRSARHSDLRGSVVHPAPTGATLTEVLMSLLIMSVGIVSVITMFPIAVLRSIQATQLTNTRMMTHNTEQSFRTLFQDSAPPSVTFDVLNYHLDPAALPANPRFRGTWLPGTRYYNGQIVTPSRPKGTYLPSSQAWMVCVLGDPLNGNLSGTVEPRWETGSPNSVTDEGIDANGTQRSIWTPWYDPTDSFPPAAPRRLGGPAAYNSVLTLIDPRLTPAGTATFYSARNYVLDPLGWATFADVGEYLNLFDTTASPNDFGYRYSKTTGLASTAGPRPVASAAGNSAAPFLLRINGGAATVADAEALASHPDSWAVEVLPTTLGLYTATVPYAGYRTATFPIPVDLSSITPGDCRIVLSSLSKTETYIRDISAANAATRTVGWAEPLPIGFEPDGPARIERRDRRFTWLATVNRDYEGHTHVTVVTFFKRGLKPEEEHAYEANFGNDGSLAPTPPLPPAAWAVSLPDQVRINWTNTGPAAEPDPLIREGNYLFDGRNATWYRIVAVSKPAATSAIITVDRPIPRSQRTNFTSAASPGRCILMRGIVELFEITL